MKLEARADEALARHVLEQRQHRVPEAIDIGEHDRLLMLLELRPGELLDEFLERPEAAGERHEGIRLHEHQMFALMHGVDHDQLLHIDQHVFAEVEEGGNDAGDVAAIVEHGAGDLAHQPDTAAAIDEADAFLGEDRAEVARGARVRSGSGRGPSRNKRKYSGC